MEERERERERSITIKSDRRSWNGKHIWKLEKFTSQLRTGPRDRLEASLLTHCLRCRIANLTARTQLCTQEARKQHAPRISTLEIFSRKPRMLLTITFTDHRFYTASTNRMKTWRPRPIELFRLCRSRADISFLFPIFSPCCPADRLIGRNYNIPSNIHPVFLY